MPQETEIQRVMRENCFTDHPPTTEQVATYAEIRHQAGALAKLLNESCPLSRELSLAMTNLEQAVLWANAAIARHST